MKTNFKLLKTEKKRLSAGGSIEIFNLELNKL